MSVCASVCRWESAYAELRFRCVGFRIYAFPILDDISYFSADSSNKPTADDDARLLLLLYGFCILICIV